MTDIDVARPTSTSRRLSQKQAARRVSSMSDSVDITDTGAQFEGRALLEEWPWRDSFMDTSMCYKEVAFSDYSSLHLYPTHEVERRKSYTSAEIKEFKNQVSADALRVQELIAEIPLERGPAVRHLISQNKLTPEELVGIDHLICDDNAARKIAFERYTHSTIVLQKQYKVKDVELAAVAIKRSSKSAKKAVVRARLAGFEEKKHDSTAKDATFSRVNSIRGLKKVESRRKMAVAA